MSDVLLAADNIHKTYHMGRGGLKVLRGCQIKLNRGEFVTIMGKSGSGKSTLLHILGALDVPEQGQVHYEREPIFAPEGLRMFGASALDALSTIERQRVKIRRSAFGFVFQFYHLLPELNVLENVLLPRMINSSTFAWWGGARREARESALEMLERVGLRERLRHRPSELSGGERQRVAIARALVHQPSILFADEPTGNLDAEAGRGIMALLCELHDDGQTIVMVTHDPAMADYTDRVVHLERGKLQ